MSPAPPPIPQDPWKKQTQNMLLKINKDIDAGFRAVITEVRNLGFQLKQFTDTTMDVLQNIEKNKSGDEKKSLDEMKEKLDDLIINLQSSAELQKGKFFELKTMINDVELNILSHHRDRRLVEERKREFNER